jgi:hypothetical protein
MIEIRKTDKRHAGHDNFAYVLEIKTGLGEKFDRPQRHFDFNQVRDWAWQTYGASCDREHWLVMNNDKRFSVNPHWCWHTEFNELKIYLATDKEANWAKLKWI